MDQSINAPIAAPNLIRERVWYGGADALVEGTAVCYNTDYGTATDFDGSRGNRVELPTSSNNMFFAGVSAYNYTASTGGQWIEINVPGSTGVKIAIAAPTVIDTGTLTFQAGGSTGAAGRFVLPGFPGRGTAEVRQTVAEGTGVLESDLVGTAWSIATDGVTLTVASTTGVAAGDSVVMLGGKAEDAAKYIVQARYVVSSVTDATTLVLTATCLASTPAGALDCIGYVYTGNPTCQADLMTGPQSGGSEFVYLVNDGGDAAVTHMTGGITYVPGGITIAADVDICPADGTFLGERKGVWLLGALTTADLTVVPVNAGITMAGGALTEVLGMDVAGDAVFLEWWGDWNTVALAGGATEA